MATKKTKAKSKPAKATKAEPKAKAAAKEKRMSALDAAAKVLSTSKEPMTCQALVEAMATKGLWKSPGGKTPAQTLYAAMVREITVKGKEARFRKVDRGQFVSA